MITFCNDKHGAPLRVESCPDLSGNNPGGTVCNVFVKTPGGWKLNKRIRISRKQYKETTVEKSIIRFMSEEKVLESGQVIGFIKEIIIAKGHNGPDNQHFLDVAKNAIFSEMHLDGNAPDENNRHFIECCDIDSDGDFYVLFTDSSERFYESDFSLNELNRICNILLNLK